jgi:hypothetical protein
MKQALIISMLLLSLSAVAQSKREITDRAIKSITTTTVDARKGDTLFRKNISRFDKKGNVIESIDYDAKGNVKDWDQFQFNRNGDEVLHIQLSSSGQPVRKTTTAYNKWNKVEELVITDETGSVIEKTSFQYNPNNDLVEETQVDKNGAVIRRTVYTYDIKGMPLSRKIFNEKGELTYSRDYINEY